MATKMLHYAGQAVAWGVILGSLFAQFFVVGTVIILLVLRAFGYVY
jgi:hypothetical protein